MYKKMFAVRLWLLAVLAAALAGCATTTAYQPLSLTGGYQERSVGHNRWYVEFFGNGHTNRDTVTAYWIYRCAEVTKEKGFDYFVLISKTPPPGASIDPAEMDGEIVYARGGYTPPVYTYIPGQSITTWSARGVIALYRDEPSASDRRSYSAQAILENLGPAVRQATSLGTNIKLPAALEALAEDRKPRESAGSPVHLDDLDNLIKK